MNKLRTFAKTLRKSLTDPAYYKDILLAKFSFSVKYLFTLLFLTSLILGLVASVRVLKLIPQTPNLVERVKELLINSYPAELRLTLKERKIVSNVREPYFIDLPDGTNISGGLFKHFLAVSTKGKIDDFRDLDSMLILTGDSLAVSDAAASFKVIPLQDTLSKVPDGAYIDKVGLELILGEVTPYFLKLLPNILKVTAAILITIYPLIRAGASLITQMIILLPVSLVLFIFARLARKQISYLKTYQFCLHGLTIPVIFSFAFGSFSFYAWGVIVAWLIFFVFMVSALWKLNSRAPG